MSFSTILITVFDKLLKSVTSVANFSNELGVYSSFTAILCIQSISNISMSLQSFPIIIISLFFSLNFFIYSLIALFLLMFFSLIIT